jgi:hypothetical protein
MGFDHMVTVALNPSQGCGILNVINNQGGRTDPALVTAHVLAAYDPTA